MKKSILILTLSFLFTALAQANSPIGVWTTIDDETDQPKSLVEITENNGVLSGKIIELFNPSEPNPVCKKCKGEKANQPIVGLEIIWGTVKKGESWRGTILDPKKGKEYKLKIDLKDEGKELKVRGYIGSPILGRTQVWIRKS